MLKPYLYWLHISVELRDEDIYSLDSMITMNYKNLESGVNKITCDWIPFFLGDDVEWYLDGERMQEDMMEIGRKVYKALI